MMPMYPLPANAATARTTTAGPDFLAKFDGSSRQPRPIQTEALRFLQENWLKYDVFVMNLPTGCHARGQKILNYKGDAVCVEDVCVGDTLLGADSTPRRVLSLCRGTQQMVRITPVKGLPFVVNLDHMLSLRYTASADRLSGTVLNITVRDYLNLPKSRKHLLKLYRAPAEFANNPNLTIPPYILGLWLGDGTSTSLSLTKCSGPLVDRWVAWGAALGLVCKITTKVNNRASTFRLTNGRTGTTNKGWDLFKALNLVDNKHIPPAYLTAGREARLELIAGLLDSDGSMSGRGGADFISVRKGLSDALAFLCRSVGLAAYVIECKKQCTNNGVWGTYWRVSVSGDLSVLPTVRLVFAPRKQKKSVLVTGFSVALLPEDNYYGFTLDGDHLYLLDDFTVTHNSGKSSIAQAISLATGAHVLTPSNILIDQYCATFTHKNFVKGKAHYTCTMATQLSCEDWQSMADLGACPDCPYKKAREAAHEHASFFNPMSYWYFTKTADFVAPKVLVVDEAHTLAQQLLQMCGVTLKSTQYPFKDEYKDEIRLCNWLKTHIERLERLRKVLPSSEKQQRATLTQEMERLSGTLYPLQDNPQNYAIWTDTVGEGRKKHKILNIKPIQLPQSVARQLLNGRKLVLMSGSIFDTDVRELIGNKPYIYKDFDSPIPVENRSINYRPVPFRLNYTTDPATLAAAIEKELAKHTISGALPNTIIHVSYASQKRLKKSLTVPMLHNDPDNKDAVVAKFIAEGGIFLAAGCAEGLDLKDDLCRLTIIPQLLYPNLSDPVVKKRKALADGEEWYAMQVLKTFMQQVGRAVRSQTDYCTIVCMDPNFARLHRRWRHKLPKSFNDSIRWA